MLVDCLGLQTTVLSNLGRVPEAVAVGRHALAMARELGYPFGQVHATTGLVIAVSYAGDLAEAARLAREGRHIPGIPHGSARVCGYLLTGVLADAGDLAAAGQVGADTLSQARDVGDLYVLGLILPVMADLDLRAGRVGDAATHLHEAARVALQTGNWFMIANGLDGSGYLCAATGRPADAVTAWAACEALEQQSGIRFTDTDPLPQRRQDAMRSVREALGQDRARAAGQRGAAMNMATASEYVLMLTDPGPSPAHASPGPSSLSARERELVRLVAQGRTDAQIAAQLFISIRTVRSHLDRIRDKTGCRRRADLTRLALAEGLA